MTTHRRKFTDDEKVEIIRQARLAGVTNILKKHNLSYSVYAKWKEKYQQDGPAGTEQQKKAEMIQLMEENKRLKRIVADQALSIEQKAEELKMIKEHHERK